MAEKEQKKFFKTFQKEQKTLYLKSYL